MRWIKKVLLVSILSLLILFCVVNRGAVSLRLFPFPYEATLPLFLLLLLAFAAGMLACWLVLSLKMLRSARLIQRSHRRAQALENELRGLRHESQTIPAIHHST